MRKLAITLAVSTTLGLAVAASAALPTVGKYAGKTSSHPINGFPNIITFTAASGGRLLTKFQFGTLGCFGNGSYPVGVDPYGDPSAIGTVKSIPVAANGTFLVTVKPTFSASDGSTTTAVITGFFANAKFASGMITISQKTSKGDKCGPAKMKFTAVPGTPQSLGLNGP
jgi:hypothetical protein